MENINISDWDVSNVTNFVGMFEGAKKITCNLSNWNVSQGRNFNSMFKNCKYC